MLNSILNFPMLYICGVVIYNHCDSSFVSIKKINKISFIKYILSVNIRIDSTKDLIWVWLSLYSQIMLVFGSTGAKQTKVDGLLLAA